MVFRFKHVQFKQDHHSSQNCTTWNVWFKQDLESPFFNLSKKNSRFLANFQLALNRKTTVSLRHTKKVSAQGGAT